MKPIFGLIAAGVLTAMLPVAALGAEKKPCREGTTVTGTCVSESLAMRSRTRGLILAQPKFSYSAPPYLPEDDYNPAIQREHLQELNALFRTPFGF
jgi:hypothetical protein